MVSAGILCNFKFGEYNEIRPDHGMKNHGFIEKSEQSIFGIIFPYNKKM
jgi:hypothetical protein